MPPNPTANPAENSAARALPPGAIIWLANHTLFARAAEQERTKVLLLFPLSSIK